MNSAPCGREGCPRHGAYTLQGHGLDTELCQQCFFEAGWVAWMLSAVLGTLR